MADFDILPTEFSGYATKRVMLQKNQSQKVKSEFFPPFIQYNLYIISRIVGAGIA
jgi:hypothetical protein